MMSDELLSVQSLYEDGVGYARVTGEIDLVSAEEMTIAVEAILCEPVASLVLDLVHVRFLDSSGLQAVLRLHRSAASRGIPFTVHVHNGSLPHRVITTVGADSVLHLVAEDGLAIPPPTERACHRPSVTP